MAKPVEIHPWRQSPFAVGATYRVRHDFAALRDVFRADETLRYERDAYSRYDGMTGYFFSQEGGERLRAWDVADDESLDTWAERFEHFEPVKPSEDTDVT